MPAKRIRQDLYERVLLTEVAPYETPINFSFWGAYNYCKNLQASTTSEYLHKLLQNKKHSASIPFKYRIRKDATSHRTLALIHPKHSSDIVSFYENHDTQILKACKKSQFSLRAPHAIAKCFHGGATDDSGPETIEDISAQTAYASSYFVYKSYSHIFKFFNSEQFTELEKRYPCMMHLDITKCFPSIYTHTISWALKGKRLAKELLHDSAAKDAYKKHAPFDVTFDRLIQSTNHSETHGIPIGPELSRIFAEVILQHIDHQIEKKLAEKNFVLGTDYTALRYIDDFFLFFKNEAVANSFREASSTELEKFKLHFNEAKTVVKLRPFLSDLSALKLRLSDRISEIARRATDGAYADATRELNSIRVILKNSATGFTGASAFFQTAISNSLHILPNSNPRQRLSFLYTYLELGCYAFRMDSGVSQSYEFSRFILQIFQLAVELDDEGKQQLLDKMKYELRGAALECAKAGYSVECCNLLILATEDSLSGTIEPEVFSIIIENLRRNSVPNEMTGECRLNYFELVTMLYATKDTLLASFRGKFIDECESILRSYDPSKYAEAAYLLLDCCSSPFLNTVEKTRLTEAALKHHYKTAAIPSGAVASFITTTGVYTWFFDWNQHRDLRLLLQKKKLRLSY